MKRYIMRYYVFFITIGVLFDQVVKIVIDMNYKDIEFNIIPNLIIYRPVLNDKFSWINSLFDIGIGKVTHILLLIILGIIVLLVFKYIRAIKADSIGVIVGFMFLISGLICSIIDKIFWGGSLDYINLKGFFTFDLKDIYATIAEVIFTIIIIANRKKVNSFKVKHFYKYITSLIRG
ncbi:signal peptidase II [Clostridiaceae bacterium M8S5]|nr:signal peptidase II [Clostridiaceae bacterium M8S5]